MPSNSRRPAESSRSRASPTHSTSRRTDRQSRAEPSSSRHAEQTRSAVPSNAHQSHAASQRQAAVPSASYRYDQPRIAAPSNAQGHGSAAAPASNHRSEQHRSAAPSRSQTNRNDDQALMTFQGARPERPRAAAPANAKPHASNGSDSTEEIVRSRIPGQDTYTYREVPASHRRHDNPRPTAPPRHSRDSRPTAPPRYSRDSRPTAPPPYPRDSRPTAPPRSFRESQTFRQVPTPYGTYNVHNYSRTDSNAHIDEGLRRGTIQPSDLRRETTITETREVTYGADGGVSVRGMRAREDTIRVQPSSSRGYPSGPPYVAQPQNHSYRPAAPAGYAQPAGNGQYDPYQAYPAALAGYAQPPGQGQYASYPAHPAGPSGMYQNPYNSARTNAYNQVHGQPRAEAYQQRRPPHRESQSYDRQAPSDRRRESRSYDREAPREYRLDRSYDREASPDHRRESRAYDDRKEPSQSSSESSYKDLRAFRRDPLANKRRDEGVTISKRQDLQNQKDDIFKSYARERLDKYLKEQVQTHMKGEEGPAEKDDYEHRRSTKGKGEGRQVQKDEHEKSRPMKRKARQADEDDHEESRHTRGKGKQRKENHRGHAHDSHFDDQEPTTVVPRPRHYSRLRDKNDPKMVEAMRLNNLRVTGKIEGEDYHDIDYLAEMESVVPEDSISEVAASRSLQRDLKRRDDFRRNV